MGRFGKENMSILSVNLLKSKSNSARCSAYAAGNIYKQRMLIVYGYAQFLKLRADSSCCYRISHKEILRGLVVHKMAVRV